MHVAYVIDHLGSGGAQRQVVELAARLVQAADVRVSVFVYHPHDFFLERLRAAGVERVQIAKRARLDPTLAWRLGAALRRARPDVVHAFLAAPAFWSLLALRRMPRDQRPPLLAAERAGRLGVGRLQGWLERVAYRGADAVTVNAGPMVQGIQGLGVAAERVHALPNGIDLARWDRARARPCPVALEPGCFHVALVGRVAPQKDHVTFLEALGQLGADRLRDWRVWLVGAQSGPSAYAAALRQQIARLGLGGLVRFLPPQPDVAALLARIDLLALPSRFEGFPNVLLEAMASGLPAVAAAVGDVPNMLEEGRTGFLVRPGDVAGLARALWRARELSETERQALGLAARRVVEERYRIEVVAARYLSLYREIASGTRAASSRSSTPLPSPEASRRSSRSPTRS